MSRGIGTTLRTFLLAAFGMCSAADMASASDASQARASGAQLDLAAARGARVFQNYCALCHGAEGTGDGRAARLYRPSPFDLTHSTTNDVYRELIIRVGGSALGRSPAMPPWKDELTSVQIRDLIAYLRVINRSSARP